MQSKFIRKLIWLLLIINLLEAFYLFGWPVLNNKTSALNFNNNKNNSALNLYLVNSLVKYSQVDLLKKAVITNRYEGTLTRFEYGKRKMGDFSYQLLFEMEGSNGTKVTRLYNDKDIAKTQVYFKMKSGALSEIKFKDLKVGDTIINEETVDLMKIHADNMIENKIIKL
jgi:hypothetical protein